MTKPTDPIKAAEATLRARKLMLARTFVPLGIAVAGNAKEAR